MSSAGHGTDSLGMLCHNAWDGHRDELSAGFVKHGDISYQDPGV